MEEKRLERDAKLPSAKLATQLELKRARMERENIEARAEVQLPASSQASQENVVALTEAPWLPGFLDGKDNLDNYLLRFESYAIIAGWQRVTWAVRLLDHCLLVKRWMFILDYPAKMLGIMTNCGRLCYRGMILPSRNIARGLGMLNQRARITRSVDR